MANTELVELNEPRKTASLGMRVVPRRRHEHHELAPAKARSAVKNFGVNHDVNIGCYSSLLQLPHGNVTFSSVVLVVVSHLKSFRLP